MTLKALRSELAFFVVVFAVIGLFRTTAWGMYYIPSESMLPTLAVGDRIIVNKSAYGYSRHSLPFSFGPDLSTDDGRLFGRLPARGDVVVFKQHVGNETTVKRVIGLPGDEIELRGGRLLLNGAPVERRFQRAYAYREQGMGRRDGAVVEVARFVEALPDRRHEILERGDRWPADDFGPVVVPDGALLVLGDNRDNSLDSRFDWRVSGRGVGLLAVDRIVGRADYIAFSTNAARKEAGLERHETRWFSKIE